MRSASAPAATGTGIESGFRGVICASFGPADALADHDTGGRARCNFSFASADPTTLADLKNVLGRSRVGVRLVLAGPPADVHAAAAAAAEAGLLDEDVTLVCNAAGPRVIYCGHCHTTTTTDQPIGSEVDCDGCSTTLAFTDHYSRRIGGYLGFSAHAEEKAA